MDTPALSELMGTYLHQDYDLIGTVDDNIDAFVREFPDLAPTLPGEVTSILTGTVSEGDLEAMLVAMGCDLLPPDGTTYRTWLSQIADRVRQTTGQR